MELSEFFAEHPAAAIAFSGGVDSAYLLYAAVDFGAEVTAYYVKSAFQPRFELDDAVRLSRELRATLKIIEFDVLSLPEIRDNPANRCYFCKKHMFSAIAQAAREDGYGLILDGTNASDREEHRPGMQALRELAVRSPLRECGLEKSEIRRRSQAAGLFTWDKPAYACLATRVQIGEVLTPEKLAGTEQAEAYLASLGFSDFRIRRTGDTAKIQLKEAQMEQLLQHRREILNELKQFYSSVTLDLEVRG